jgi:Fe-S-cluster containining protein
MPDAASKCLCDDCVGLCCRYFALPIDNPEAARDYDNIRWYLLHENVTVFVEKSQWYIGIANRCKQLQPDNRCGVYATRPKVCRGYSTDNCDYHGGDYEFEMLFTSAEQLETYAAKTLAEARAESRKKAARKAKRKQNGKPRPNLMTLADKLKRRMAGGGGVNGNGNGNGSNGNGRRVKLPLL